MRLRKTISYVVFGLLYIIFTVTSSHAASNNKRDASIDASKSGKKTDVYVIKVIDGDSFIVRYDDHKANVRLAGIDAPEMNQSFGRESKKFLSDLIFQKTVVLLMQKKDKYGRILCDAYIDGILINDDVVKNGYAWAYRPEHRSITKSQITARKHKLGLWNEKNPQSPWSWRKKNRKYRLSFR
jgi:micrococcal nuclease